MSLVEEFEKLLKETVNAKRLSESRMTKLTELTMKCIENDTQLVSILYRTHKTLPVSGKVYSLYVFDALCRAARHQVKKRGITGSLNSEIGNCATFLLKIEGVLDGLFHDMTNAGSSECKEKAQKILDIWGKHHTFSSAVLARLKGIVSQSDKVPDEQPTVASDPRTKLTQRSTTPAGSPPANALDSYYSAKKQPSTQPDPQATLLALLTQAAQASVVTNATAASPPNPDVSSAPSQLALLQQLAAAATQSNSNVAAQTGLNLPQSVLNHNLGAHITPPPSLPYIDGAFDNTHEHRYERDRGRRENQYDSGNADFAQSRGGYRGGRYGGDRGRGRGRWDSRAQDSNYARRGRGGGWNSGSDRQPRRSRSRSPPNRRPNFQPYSPPHRPTMPSATSSQQDNFDDRSRSDKTAVATDPNVDEFGRALRSSSPVEHSSTPTQPLKPVSSGISVPPVTSNASNSLSSSVEPPNPVSDGFPTSAFSNQMSLPMTDTNTSTQNADPSISKQKGLESFELALFDFTNPTSWVSLGNMWEVTNGYAPSQEQLMQFIMMHNAAAMSGMPMQLDHSAQPQSGMWMDSSTSQPWGGNARGNQSKAFPDANGAGSDAVVLSADSDPDPPRSTGAGRMEKVGEKWMFVRDSVALGASNRT